MQQILKTNQHRVRYLAKLILKIDPNHEFKFKVQRLDSCDENDFSYQSTFCDVRFPNLLINEDPEIRKSLEQSFEAPHFPAIYISDANEEKFDGRRKSRLSVFSETKHLLSVEPKRSRSPSPVWVPGETSSYAEVVRSGSVSRSGSRCTSPENARAGAWRIDADKLFEQTTALKVCTRDRSRSKRRSMEPNRRIDSAVSQSPERRLSSDQQASQSQHVNIQKVDELEISGNQKKQKNKKSKKIPEPKIKQNETQISHKGEQYPSVQDTNQNESQFAYSIVPCSPSTSFPISLDSENTLDRPQTIPDTVYDECYRSNIQSLAKIIDDRDEDEICSRKILSETVTTTTTSITQITEKIYSKTKEIRNENMSTDISDVTVDESESVKSAGSQDTKGSKKNRKNKKNAKVPELILQNKEQNVDLKEQEILPQIEFISSECTTVDLVEAARFKNVSSDDVVAQSVDSVEKSDTEIPKSKKKAQKNKKEPDVSKSAPKEQDDVKDIALIQEKSTVEDKPTSKIVNEKSRQGFATDDPKLKEKTFETKIEEKDMKKSDQKKEGNKAVEKVTPPTKSSNETKQLRKDSSKTDQQVKPMKGKAPLAPKTIELCEEKPKSVALEILEHKNSAPKIISESLKTKVVPKQTGEVVDDVPPKPILADKKLESSEVVISGKEIPKKDKKKFKKNVTVEPTSSADPPKTLDSVEEPVVCKKTVRDLSDDRTNVETSVSTEQNLISEVSSSIAPGQSDKGAKEPLLDDLIELVLDEKPEPFISKTENPLPSLPDEKLSSESKKSKNKSQKDTKITETSKPVLVDEKPQLIDELVSVRKVCSKTELPSTVSTASQTTKSSNKKDRKISKKEAAPPPPPRPMLFERDVEVEDTAARDSKITIFESKSDDIKLEIVKTDHMAFSSGASSPQTLSTRCEAKENLQINMQKDENEAKKEVLPVAASQQIPDVSVAKTDKLESATSFNKIEKKGKKKNAPKPPSAPVAIEKLEAPADSVISSNAQFDDLLSKELLGNENKSEESSSVFSSEPVLSDESSSVLKETVTKIICETIKPEKDEISEIIEKKLESENPSVPILETDLGLDSNVGTVRKATTEKSNEKSKKKSTTKDTASASSSSTVKLDAKIVEKSISAESLTKGTKKETVPVEVSPMKSAAGPVPANIISETINAAPEKNSERTIEEKNVDTSTLPVSTPNVSTPETKIPESTKKSRKDNKKAEAVFSAPSKKVDPKEKKTKDGNFASKIAEGDNTLVEVVKEPPSESENDAKVKAFEPLVTDRINKSKDERSSEPVKAKADSDKTSPIDTVQVTDTTSVTLSEQQQESVETKASPSVKSTALVLSSKDLGKNGSKKSKKEVKKPKEATTANMPDTEAVQGNLIDTSNKNIEPIIIPTSQEIIAESTSKAIISEMDSLIPAPETAEKTELPEPKNRKTKESDFRVHSPVQSPSRKSKKEKNKNKRELPTKSIALVEKETKRDTPISDTLKKDDDESLTSVAEKTALSSQNEKTCTKTAANEHHKKVENSEIVVNKEGPSKAETVTSVIVSNNATLIDDSLPSVIKTDKDSFKLDDSKNVSSYLAENIQPLFDAASTLITEMSVSKSSESELKQDSSAGKYKKSNKRGKTAKATEFPNIVANEFKESVKSNVAEDLPEKIREVNKALKEMDELLCNQTLQPDSKTEPITELSMKKSEESTFDETAASSPSRADVKDGNDAAELALPKKFKENLGVPQSNDLSSGHSELLVQPSSDNITSTSDSVSLAPSDLDKLVAFDSSSIISSGGVVEKIPFFSDPKEKSSKKCSKGKPSKKGGKGDKADLSIKSESSHIKKIDPTYAAKITQECPSTASNFKSSPSDGTIKNLVGTKKQDEIEFLFADPTIPEEKETLPSPVERSGENDISSPSRNPIEMKDESVSSPEKVVKDVKEAFLRSSTLSLPNKQGGKNELKNTSEDSETLLENINPAVEDVVKPSTSPMPSNPVTTASSMKSSKKKSKKNSGAVPETPKTDRLGSARNDGSVVPAPKIDDGSKSPKISEQINDVPDVPESWDISVDSSISIVPGEEIIGNEEIVSPHSEVKEDSSNAVKEVQQIESCPLPISAQKVNSPESDLQKDQIGEKQWKVSTQKSGKKGKKNKQSQTDSKSVRTVDIPNPKDSVEFREKSPDVSAPPLESKQNELAPTSLLDQRSADVAETQTGESPDSTVLTSEQDGTANKAPAGDKNRKKKSKKGKKVEFEEPPNDLKEIPQNISESKPLADELLVEPASSLLDPVSDAINEQCNVAEAQSFIDSRFEIDQILKSVEDENFPPVRPSRKKDKSRTLVAEEIVSTASTVVDTSPDKSIESQKEQQSAQLTESLKGDELIKETDPSSTPTVIPSDIAVTTENASTSEFTLRKSKNKKKNKKNNDSPIDDESVSLSSYLATEGGETKISKSSKNDGENDAHVVLDDQSNEPKIASSAKKRVSGSDSKKAKHVSFSETEDIIDVDLETLHDDYSLVFSEPDILEPEVVADQIPTDELEVSDERTIDQVQLPKPQESPPIAPKRKLRRSKAITQPSNIPPKDDYPEQREPLLALDSEKLEPVELLYTEITPLLDNSAKREPTELLDTEITPLLDNSASKSKRDLKKRKSKKSNSQVLTSDASIAEEADLIKGWLTKQKTVIQKPCESNQFESVPSSEGTDEIRTESTEESETQIKALEPPHERTELIEQSETQSKAPKHPHKLSFDSSQSNPPSHRPSLEGISPDNIILEAQLNGIFGSVMDKHYKVPEIPEKPNVLPQSLETEVKNIFQSDKKSKRKKKDNSKEQPEVAPFVEVDLEKPDTTEILVSTYPPEVGLSLPRYFVKPTGEVIRELPTISQQPTTSGSYCTDEPNFKMWFVKDDEPKINIPKLDHTEKFEHPSVWFDAKESGLVVADQSQGKSDLGQLKKSKKRAQKEIAKGDTKSRQQELLSINQAIKKV